MSDIIVYSTPTCPWCNKLKDFLASRGVSYHNVNVQEDQEKAKVMVEKSGQMGVPQIEINGKILVGFDQEAMERELDIANDKK